MRDDHGKCNIEFLARCTELQKPTDTRDPKETMEFIDSSSDDFS